MKPITAFFLALFGTASLAAQTATSQIEPFRVAPAPGSHTVAVYDSKTQKTTTIVVNAPQQLGSCPVSVRAQQSSAANLMQVDRSRPKGLAQLLHLTLANSGDNRVAKATVTVRGLLPKTRPTLTPMTRDSDPSDAARTIEATFPAATDAASTDKIASADIWVPGLSAVYTVDLVSITYADGSTWTASTARSCRTPIDGMMLIGAR